MKIVQAVGKEMFRFAGNHHSNVVGRGVPHGRYEDATTVENENEN
jgi:hypothetical protein